MRHLKGIVLLYYFLFTSLLPVFSQCAINGIVSDTLQVLVPFNPVALIKYNDSAIVKGGITDIDGKFCFEGIKAGTYRLKISAIGYATYYSDKMVYDSVSPLPAVFIRLQPGGVDLSEIAVFEQKKTVEFKNGNITVHVEGTALEMGNTAYDLLLRLPGVTVSDGIISIQGKSGVKILVDGKLQQLSGSQLTNLLKSMNAAQIEKIEVLKKPPVRYDAAGTGGMINIKTKKVKMVGFSGSLFGSHSQGFYGNPSGGFVLNYKGRKVNFFSGFTAERDWLRLNEHFKNTFNYSATETTLLADYTTKQHGHYETYNLGADWFINKSNSIGIKMNGALGFGNEDRTAVTNFSDNTLGYQKLILHSAKPNPWIYPEFNINAEHLFDTMGTALRFSADYNPYWDIYAAGFDNYYLGAAGQNVNTPSVFKTSNTLLFTNTSALVDFEKELKKKFKLEAGLKHSYQVMSSDYYLKNMDYSTGTMVLDSVYSNMFNYKQNISAAYVNLTKDYKKFSFQLGLRGENTVINTLSQRREYDFNRQYFNIFPLISLDYKKSENHTFSVSYNKRVNRPDYNSFNPFIVFLSTQTSYKGNPYLKPEYSHDFSLAHSYKSWLNNTVDFTRIYNSFMGYNTQNDSSKSYVNTSTNMKWADVYSYSLFIQKDLFKWWSINFNATVFHINAHGSVNNLPYAISTTAFTPNLYSRLTFTKGYSVEINAFYLSPFLEGIYYTKSRSYVNVSFKKSFLENKLSVAFAFNDIFFGQIRNTTINYQNQHGTGRQTFDTRRINISINYNFGNLKVEQRKVKDIAPQERSKK